jgi:CHASE3 domain sensor protein
MKLKIGQKLLGIFAVVWALLVLVGVVAMFAVDGMTQVIQQILEEQSGIGLVSQVREYTFHESVLVDHYLMFGEKDELTAAQNVHKEQMDTFMRLEEHMAEHGGTAAAQKLKSAYDVFHGYLNDAIKSYQTNSKDTATAFAKLETAHVYMEETLDPLAAKMNDDEQARVLALNKSQLDKVNSRRVAVFIIFVIAFALSIIPAHLISNGIARSAQQISTAAAAISRGNLDTVIDIKTGDEMQTVAESVERMRTSLKSAIERLRSRQTPT